MWLIWSSSTQWLNWKENWFSSLPASASILSVTIATPPICHQHMPGTTDHNNLLAHSQPTHCHHGNNMKVWFYPIKHILCFNLLCCVYRGMYCSVIDVPVCLNSWMCMFMCLWTDWMNVTLEYTTNPVLFWKCCYSLDLSLSLVDHFIFCFIFCLSLSFYLCFCLNRLISKTSVSLFAIWYW